MARNYKVDFVSNSVVVTKKFMDAASQVGSEEYNTLMTLRGQGFTIVAPTAKKRSGDSDWTYEQMRTYIGCCQNAATLFVEFNAMMAAAKAQTNPHGFMKKWFNTNFPMHGKTPTFDKNYKIIDGESIIARAKASEKAADSSNENREAA